VHEGKAYNWVLGLTHFFYVACYLNEYLIQISKFAIHISNLEIWVNAAGLFKLQTK